MALKDEFTALLPVVGGRPEVAYTELGAYTPPRRRKFVPYAERVNHVSRHAVTASRVRSLRDVLRLAHSTAREIGDILVGAFMPVAA